MSNAPTSSNPAPDLAQQVAELFIQAFGSHPGFRLAHAKGLVVEGVFEPSTTAGEICRAAPFNGGVIPIVGRFSNGTGVPQIPDSDPHSNPKGFAIRFKLPDGQIADIVANGLNGFVAGTPQDFVDFFRAVITTAPDSPKPTPIERFLGVHPRTAAYLAQPNPTPASFATQTYYGNNAFIFINAQGQRVATRYQIVPLAGENHLAAEAAAKMPPDFLINELGERLGKGPVEFQLLVELAEPGDPTHDATIVWGPGRKKVELGIIRLTAVDPRSAVTERALTFDPIHIVDGIELSEDPLPAFRSEVYSISIARRQAGR